MAAVAEAVRGGPGAGPDVAEQPEMRLFEPGGATLEDSILGVCEELAATGRAECPVCGGRLRVRGACEGCGSELT